MKCKIVARRSAGRLREGRELAEPAEEEVEIDDFESTTDGRPRRFHCVAYFRTDDNGASTYMRQAMPPLFDPRIVKLKGRTLILGMVRGWSSARPRN